MNKPERRKYQPSHQYLWKSKHTTRSRAFRSPNNYLNVFVVSECIRVNDISTGYNAFLFVRLSPPKILTEYQTLLICVCSSRFLLPSSTSVRHPSLRRRFFLCWRSSLFPLGLSSNLHNYKTPKESQIAGKQQPQTTRANAKKKFI